MSSAIVIGLSATVSMFLGLFVLWVTHSISSNKFNLERLEREHDKLVESLSDNCYKCGSKKKRSK